MTAAPRWGGMTALLGAILDALGSRVAQRKPNGEIVIWCPFHLDGQGSPPHSPNLTIKPGNKAAYVWACPVCDIGGTLLDLADRLREAGIMPPRDGQRPKSRIATTCDYRDEQGTLLSQAVRYEPKAFKQRRPDSKGGWIWNLDGVRRVPYRLPELMAADPAQWVHIPEGEKDADSLARLGLAATTNSEGGGKWRDELSPYLKGRRVAILPDNDALGQAHAQGVARKLAPYAAEVRIVNLPGLPDKGDVSDWLAQGHTKEELVALVEAASPYELPEPVGGAVLLDDVVAYIRRYVVLSDEQAAALALWVLHTHAIEAAEATPYLSVGSPEKRSGKTRLLEVLSLLVRGPWFTGRVTAAVLVRRLAKETPTLLLDESDAAFSAEREYAATLRGILNAGYRRGGCASLCVGKGAEMDYRDFPVFGPKAIAGIGQLPDTVADRAIAITLKRRAPNEPVKRFRWRDAEEEARELRDAAALWASGNTAALAEARPDLPPELDDRAADVWEPLLAIADLVGGDWPRMARKAARVLSAGEWRDDDSGGVKLLTDIRDAFKNDDRLFTVVLLERLHALPESPWFHNATTLAKALKPFGVKPKLVRVGEAVGRGYEAAAFEDAWGRYCGPAPIPEKGVTPVTPVTNDGPKYNLGEPSVTPVTPVTPSGGMDGGVEDAAADNAQQDSDLDDAAAPPCPHRPPGEADDRWAHQGGPDPCVCACCDGPVRPDLWADGLCPVCRNGRPVSGSLVRLAVDLGAKVVEA